MPDPTRAVWRKSTRSNNGGNCVEVADNLLADQSVVFIRDSKHPAGPVLAFTPRTWKTFVTSAKAGTFDRT